MKRLRRASLALAGVAGRAWARLPGLLALGCAFAGAWLVAGLGVGLLVAAGLLLLIDAGMP